MRAGGTSIIFGFCCKTLSYRAGLALASSSWPRNLGHPWHQHLPALPRRHESRDVETFALAAPVEPLVNHPLRPVDEAPGLIGVANDAVVVPVA
jgi:hypothetical protein